MKKMILPLFLVVLLFPTMGMSYSSITLHNNCSSWLIYTVFGRSHGSHCWYMSAPTRIKRKHSHKFKHLSSKCAYNITGQKPVYRVKKHEGNIDIYNNDDGELGCRYHRYP